MEFDEVRLEIEEDFHRVLPRLFALARNDDQKTRST